MTALVELADVTKRYEAVEGADGPLVLTGVSLAIEPGDSLAVVGPSGSGKSTLLNLVGALDRPTTGRVLFDGRDLAGLDDEELAELRNRRIGFIFQSHHLLPQLSALENALVPTLVSGDRARRTEADARARALFDRVGLADRLAHRPGKLSGGECQRVAVVRALVNQPDLLLADEPTGSLDARSATELADLLADLNREEGVTLVTVTHSERLADRMGRLCALEDGRLSERGVPR